MRIVARPAERLLPAIGDRGERRIKRRSQFGDETGERIGVIFIFAAPEAVPAHHHAAAEAFLLAVTRGDADAFLGRQKHAGGGDAEAVELGADAVPIDPGEA